MKVPYIAKLCLSFLFILLLLSKIKNESMCTKKQHKHSSNCNYSLIHHSKTVTYTSMSYVTLLQILCWYSSKRARGEEEGRQGHGRWRRGQTGWDRNYGWSVREGAVTGFLQVHYTGADGGVKEHRGGVQGVCVCRQKIKCTFKSFL